jgi:hypothetical protein
MFVQVIQGQVTDPSSVFAKLDQWLKELAPGAMGWLGSTGGVTEDGRLIALVRFETEQDARRNSARPEQDQWSAEMSELFTGEPTFHDSTEVILDIVGAPDHAGFVQVMQGRGTNPDRARELMSENSEEWAAFRPEVLGTVGAMYDEGAYTMAIYFTSEAEAREGEGKEPPPKLKAQMDELNSLAMGAPEFFDLKHPWLHSPM